MPKSLPDYIAKALANEGINTDQLNPGVIDILGKLARKPTKLSERRLNPYHLIAEQADIAFHINESLDTLWFKSDSHLRQHIPDNMPAGAPLKEYLPIECYLELIKLIESFKKNGKRKRGEIALGTGGSLEIKYRLRLIEDEYNGLVLLLNNDADKQSTERQYIESIRQLEQFNDVLVQLNKKVNSIRTIEKLHATIAETAKSAINADRISVWVMSADNQSFELKFDCSGTTQSTHTSSKINRAQFPEFFANLDNERVHCVQIEKQSLLSKFTKTQSLYQPEARSILESPIRFEGQVIGLLRAEFFAERHWLANNEQVFFASLSDLYAQAHEKLIKEQTEAALNESENRFRALTENSDTAIFAFEDHFLYANPALEMITGLSLNRLKETPVENVFNKHFQAVHKQAAIENQSTRTKDTSSLKHEVEITTSIGERRWLYVTTTRSNFDGKNCWLASAFDISERKTSEARLKFQARHDQLTGLPNRNRFQERVGAALARASRDRFYKFAVLFINIDRFKVFNDSMGQLLGDQLLLELSKRIRLCLESSGIAARVSGDEFAVFIDDVFNEENVLSAVKAIQASVSEPIHFEAQETVCSASIGIVVANNAYDKPEYVIRDASIAMYHAKEDDSPGYRFFNPEMHERAKRILETENELRIAIRKQSLELYYQPIVSLKDESVAYFEALIRWHKSSSTTVSPLDFIPLAEESGVILPLGRWVVNQAGEQLALWQKNGWPEIGVSINVSGKQFQAEEISEDVKIMLENNNIRENSLKIEITESSMIQNSETIQEQLQRLRALGCDLLVDDFGTGYSSLSYLHQFPINCIKIDRSFTTSLRQEEESHEIVRAITNLAHNLQLEVIAEGVETPEQVEILKKIGCNYAQGYYYSTPLRVNDATQYLQENRPTTFTNNVN